MGAETKLLTATTPAMQGFQAARLAAAGVRGNLALFEAPRGFWETFTLRRRSAFLIAAGRFQRKPGASAGGIVIRASRSPDA